MRTGALLQRGGVWFPMTPRQVLELTASYYDAPRDADELLELLDLGAMRPDAVAPPQRRRTATNLAGARAARTSAGTRPG